MITNLRMHEKVRDGEAIDLSDYPREGTKIVLDYVIDGMDYCILKEEKWIWSIGKRKSDGKILASKLTDLFVDPNFEILWLR